MTDTPDEPAADDATDDTMTFDVEVRDDRTILTIEGVRDAAVIVRSQENERIYLPPETFDASPSVTSPYSTSPYSAATDEDASEGTSTGDEAKSDDSIQTPYSRTDDEATAGEITYGRSVVSQGIRIVHPEPATDVRVVR
ncbi:MAG: DUF7510 family protein [Halapricum sp.]